MSHDTPTPIRLEDYTPPPFLIDAVKLDVDVRETGTIITALLDVQRNPALAARGALALDCEDLETLAVGIDGRTLAASEFSIEDNRLTIAEVPDRFVLKTTVRIQPDKNTQLSGFYRSRDGYFTQCEPEGFRRITWFIDRPDVMARYTVTLHADKATFPILLANGNPVASGDEGGEDEGRHFATWEDPFRKPSYLFAMVAGKLDVLRDTYRTASGRDVLLAIFVEPGKLDQCAHAMEALKKSMRWDEQRFGLECDLDHYMIVAVGDFNMGAMENKGLNIFNTKYVLARADLATDTDFENIDRVVAHEYFHNWTGNRVTCRDWFQLSLKEGLTVFRDQEFGADTHSRQVARIREVRGLRAMQFPEDAGPMAHPVRPSTYVEINNFYTATVYEKGAEVVRMIQTLIGREAFRKGMDIYFERHDGQAVTCDDFVAAMAAASGFDFTPFMAWYRQAGTPRVTARGTYDAGNHRYTLTLAQSCAPTPGQPEKTPYLIPVAVGLVGPDGENFDLTVQTPSFRRKPESRIAENELDPGLRRDDGESRQTVVLQLTEPEQTFVFENVPAAPVPSLLRNFSAPVVLDYPYSDADLAHLLAHDSDPFNRWEAGQRLFGRLILDNAERIGQGAQAEIRLTARVTAPPVRGQALSARAAVENISLQAGLLRLAGHAGWTDGAADSWLAGPLDVDILASLGQDAADHGAATPEGSVAPADAGRMPENVQLPAKAQLRTTLKGPLQAPDALVSFDCPAWSVGGHSLADASLRLQSTPFNWRQVLSGGAAQPLQPLNAPAELAVSVQAVATVDKFSQSLGATLFARQVQDNGRSAVQAGDCARICARCSASRACTAGRVRSSSSMRMC